MMNKQELICIVGGVSISATLVNAFARGINTLLELGRSLGSAIRRIFDKKLCSY